MSAGEGKEGTRLRRMPVREEDLRAEDIVEPVWPCELPPEEGLSFEEWRDAVFARAGIREE